MFMETITKQLKITVLLLAALATSLLAWAIHVKAATSRHLPDGV